MGLEKQTKAPAYQGMIYKQKIHKKTLRRANIPDLNPYQLPYLWFCVVLPNRLFAAIAADFRATMKTIICTLSSSSSENLASHVTDRFMITILFLPLADLRRIKALSAANIPDRGW
jgi:hypothetical protein